ncbi:MAG: TetR/AcrR family transcriptional regulator [Acidobacteriota bacterium]
MPGARHSSRQSLVDAAIRILASQPGASLDEIARAAGVGRATLYRHFGSRDGLVRELALASIAETDEAVSRVPRDTSAVEQLRGVLEAVVPLGDRFHFLSQENQVMQDADIAPQVERQLEGLSSLIASVKAEGGLAPDVPDAWVVAAIDSLIYAAWSSVHGGWVARREAPKLVFRTIMRGLGSSADS